MANEVLQGEAHDFDRIKCIDVPGLGIVDFHMRYRDRRNGFGYAQIEARDGVRFGYGVTRNYGRRRTVLVQFEAETGAVRTLVFGPIPGLRGRASPRYGARHAQDWVAL